MTDKKTKRIGYLENALKEVDDLIQQADDTKAVATKLKDLISRKLLESFQNGIKVGMKKAGKVE
jgi:hypothetical protein